MKYYRTKDVIKKYAEKIANDAYCDYGVGNGKPNKEDMNISTNFFSEVPTIDIVRCGECKCCRDELIEEHMPLYIYCEKWNHETDFDSFCSAGEWVEE